MKLTTPVLIVVFFLSACAPSETAIQTAIAQTQAAQPTATIQPSSTLAPTLAPTSTITPTATPTVVPLVALDLEPILVKPGDLPAGYSTAQFSNILPSFFSKAIQSDKSFYLEFAHNNRSAGGIAVMIFENYPPDLNTAFEIITDSIGKNASPIPGPGQKAIILSFTTALGDKVTQILFAECQALVHIIFTDTNDDRISTSYALRFDERLKPLVCNKKTP